MKIIITSKEKFMEGAIDPRFGRCANFLVYDEISGGIEAVENLNASMAGGAGVQAAQFAVSKGADAVISGSFGPNAFNALKAAGIEMYLAGESKTAKEAALMLKEGRLQNADEAGNPKKSGS